LEFLYIHYTPKCQRGLFLDITDKNSRIKPFDELCI
jgi:hypothetical protein